MGILCGLCMVVLMGLSFMARREPTPSRKLFYRSAAFLYRFTKRKPSAGRHKTISGNSKIAKNLQVLHPGINIDKKMKQYYIEKIRLVLFLVFWGNLLSWGIFVCQMQEKVVDEGGVIRKNTWNQGDMSLKLQAVAGCKEDLTVLIEPRNLTEKEAGLLAEEAFRKLIPAVLNKNTDRKRITGTLNLISQLEKYPFHISWESSHPHIVKLTGEVVNDEVNEQIPAEGIPVLLTAWLLYDDSFQQFRYKKEIGIKVYPQEKTAREKWREELYRSIEDRKTEDAYKETLRLPQTVRGIAVRWREKSANDSIYLWMIVILTSFLITKAKDNDLNKRVINRNRQLEKDYPELVSKLTLYLGAGMTVKNAWKRIVQDYVNRKSAYQEIERQKNAHYKSVYTRFADQRPAHKKNRRTDRVLYEEMLISWHELENGVSEGEVYYQFGKRTGGHRYRKLSGLLYNHLQKGNKNLLQVLREEIESAWEERKNKARISGEEMGTKLLFPMMIMLILVMVIIMVPAYMAL